MCYIQMERDESASASQVRITEIAPVSTMLYIDIDVHIYMYID